MTNKLALLTMAIAMAMTADSSNAASDTFSFPALEGGTHDMADWDGQPVLVVNTASQCGFTPQYDGLQALYDRYRDDGLVVLAVPSDDFRQELGSAEEIKEFCEVNFGLDIPMTDVTHVRGREAHPFYVWVQSETGFAPRWNFNKILIGADGQIAGTWGSRVKPTGREIVDAIEAALTE